MYQHTVTIQIRDNAQHPWTSAPSITVISEGPVPRALRGQQHSSEPSLHQLYLPPPMRATRYRCSICGGYAFPDKYQTWFQASYLNNHRPLCWFLDPNEETLHPTIGRLLTESVIKHFYVSEADVTTKRRGCDLAAFYIDNEGHRAPQTPYKDLWIHICGSCLAGLQESVYPISPDARTEVLHAIMCFI